jgi:hypothetical protein
MNWEFMMLIIGIVFGLIGLFANITSILGYLNIDLKKYEKIEVTSFTHLALAPNFIHTNDQYLQTIEFNPIFQLTNPTNKSIIINDFALSIKNHIDLKMATFKNPLFESTDIASNFSSIIGDKSKLRTHTYPFQVSPHSNMFIRIHFEIIFFDSKNHQISFPNDEDKMNRFIGVLFGMSENEVYIMRIPHSLSIISGKKEFVYNFEQLIPIIGKAIVLETMLKGINNPQRVNVIKKIG